MIYIYICVYIYENTYIDIYTGGEAWRLQTFSPEAHWASHLLAPTCRDENIWKMRLDLFLQGFPRTSATARMENELCYVSKMFKLNAPTSGRW